MSVETMPNDCVDNIFGGAKYVYTKHARSGKLMKMTEAGKVTAGQLAMIAFGAESHK